MIARRSPALASPVAFPETPDPLGVNFLDVRKESGLNAKTIYGGEALKNK